MKLNRDKKGSYILVIVESPGKIKKLETILGPGYVVTSSYGHIMDLHSKKMSVDFDNDFEPEYHIITGERKFQDKEELEAFFHTQEACLSLKHLISIFGMKN